MQKCDLFNKKIPLLLQCVRNGIKKDTNKTMNDVIHLRIPQGLNDILLKISHESGMSKQSVIRQMIISQLEMKYGDNIVMNIQDVKKQIKQQYENTSNY
jgi:hypothetical protein